MTSTTARAPAAGRLDAGYLAGLAGLVSAAPGRPRQASAAPFDDSPVGTVPTCTAEDVRTAQDRARAAQGEWAGRTLADRCRVVLRFADLVLRHRDRLLDVLQVETGKARINAFEELADVVLTARYGARTAARHLRPGRRRGALPGLTRPVVHQRPKGLVGVISPWDTPMTLAVSDALAALLAGNAVVLKPATQTPFSALAVVALLREAGLPPDLFAVVTGRGSELGAPLIEGVDHVTFTGSTATGRGVADRSARRLIGCSAELGGKNPMLVLADADLGRAVEGAVRGCFSNAGQLCMHLERLYVEDAAYERFVPALAHRVRRIRLGPGFGWDVEMGSLTTRRQFAVVTRHVEDAVARGARVPAGGRPRPDLGPLFFEPTLLEGVTDDMPVAREETFGPVVTVTRVRNADEAVQRANDSPYGLNASVWSTPRRGAAVAARIRAGTVNVNEGYAAAWASHDAPMGGVRQSGLGRRHGREGFLAYTEAQTVAVQRGLPLGPLPGMPLDRYAALMTGALRVLRRVPGA